MQINIDIAEKVARVIGSPTIICGNSDYIIHFSFDEEWEAYNTKTARFKFLKDKKHKYIDVIFEGMECPVPVLSGIDNVKIGVYAGDLKTTIPAVIPCNRSILCGDPEHEKPSEDVYNQIMALLNSGGGGSGGTMEKPRIAYIDLFANKWVGNETPYSQVVNIEGITANTQVDLTPSVEQLSAFYNKDLAFVTENENGVVTVYAIGQKPTNDYRVQVTLTEVKR